MFSKKLSNLIRARFPFIYISTYEEDRITELIKNMVMSSKSNIKREIFTWTQTSGLWNQTTDKNIQGTINPLSALEFIENYDKNALFMMYDFHVNFGIKNRPADYDVIRKLRDLSSILKTSNLRKNIVFIAPEVIIPDTLQKELTILDFPLPNLEEIKSKLNKMISQNPQIKADTLSEDDKDRLCKSALGLTLQEAENAFALAMVNDGRIDIKDLPVILNEKIQIIKKTGILEFIQSDLSIDDIGGLENLKNWLKKRNNSWLEKAKRYCIPAPKGVLITGIPGCGKSLTAKAMSTMWQLPLLRLDLGKIFSGLVGSSEENMRKAIATAEAVAPSILWVDEIEKGLSGIGSGNDSGVSSRIFGTFLTWMQEKESPVFVIATANNINALPPELLRKGRFDEIFFVDLPTFKEREAIFKVHLTKRLKDKEISQNIPLTQNTYSHLANLTEGFIGAEIEQVVVSALCEAFFENRALKFSDFEKVISTIVPLSTTQKEQIIAIRQWANIRAVSATKKEDYNEYPKSEPKTTEHNSKNDITKERGGRTLDF